MSSKRFVMSFFLGLWASVSLWAQAPAAGVAVHMVVTVEPHHGATPPAISQSDVLVFEGKDRDTVTEWVPAQGDRGALEVMVLLDDGSSFSLGRQLEDIRQFILEQPANAKVGLAYMQNGTAKVEVNLTTDHAAVAKALRLPMGAAGINGSPYFSLSDLAKRWPPSDARHEVMMVTDGIDRYYGTGDLEDPYLSAAIDDAERAGILVSGIYNPGIGHFAHSYWQSYWGQLYLSELCERTGGEAYYIGFTGSPVAFTPYLEDFSHRLMNQYLLTFLAKPPKKPGFQRVKIKTEVQKVDLVAPDQVYVQ